MLTLLVRRVVRLVVVLVGVSLVTFAILQASGDPVALMMPEAPESDRAVLRQNMGFNDPLAIQVVRFVGGRDDDRDRWDPRRRRAGARSRQARQAQVPHQETDQGDHERRAQRSASSVSRTPG